MAIDELASDYKARLGVFVNVSLRLRGVLKHPEHPSWIRHWHTHTHTHTHMHVVLTFNTKAKQSSWVAVQTRSSHKIRSANTHCNNNFNHFPTYLDLLCVHESLHMLQSSHCTWNLPYCLSTPLIPPVSASSVHPFIYNDNKNNYSYNNRICTACREIVAVEYFNG